ncbi:MAG: hypothetical protein CM1200mP15_11210 [Dehalococcoidia bacterium]|nr:MAG: hypothetical protein CM1200mP15_11210 [Dehalococcoidia bacterium]
MTVCSNRSACLEPKYIINPTTKPANPKQDYQQQWVPSVRNSWTDTYQCKDGRWLRFCGTSNKNWNDFLDAAGVTSWGEEWTDRAQKLDEEQKSN